MSQSRAHAQSAYDDHHVANDSPIGLVARVFQTALLDTRRARIGIEKGDPVAKGKAIGRLLRALSLLQGSLDMEQGGDAAATFDRLYNYLIVEVSRANVENCAKILATIEPLIAELGGAWGEAAERERRENDGKTSAAEPAMSAAV